VLAEQVPFIVVGCSEAVISYILTEISNTFGHHRSWACPRFSSLLEELLAVCQSKQPEQGDSHKGEHLNLNFASVINMSHYAVTKPRFVGNHSGHVEVPQ
jgi:hypothetical protein